MYYVLAKTGFKTVENEHAWYKGLIAYLEFARIAHSSVGRMIVYDRRTPWAVLVKHRAGSTLPRCAVPEVALRFPALRFEERGVCLE